MRLLGAENIGGGQTEKYWLHSDGRGNDNITIQVCQDAAPIIKQLKQQVRDERAHSGVRLKARIPATMMDEASRISAKEWGVSVRDAFAEIVKQKTDRAKRTLRLLTEGRDYRKLQAKAYR